MIPLVPSEALSMALLARQTELLQLADKEAADTGVNKGDPRFVYGQCMLILLTEVFLNLAAGLRALNAQDDNLDKMVAAALERAKRARSETDAKRRARAQ